MAGKFNDQFVDLKTPLNEDGHIQILTDRDHEALEILRHSTAHLMAQAIKRLYKNVKFGVGPVIEDGFYYDMDLGDETISPEDLPRIEQEMRRIIKENLPIERKVVSREEAKRFFQEIGDEYKLELIDDIPEDENHHPVSTR